MKFKSPNPGFFNTKNIVYNENMEPLIKETRGMFLERLKGKFTEEEIEEIDFAYDIAKESHRPAVRDQGMRYFEHPREGCLIITDELELFDKDILISFLLHDVGEDTPMFGNIIKSYDEFVYKAKYRINKLFGSHVADIVIRLSNPQVDNIRFHSKEEAQDFYLEELKKSEDAILCKMVDRLHNLRTLSSCKPEKVLRKIEETEKKYIPIFSSVKGEKVKYTSILLEKILEQLKELKN